MEDDVSHSSVAFFYFVGWTNEAGRDPQLEYRLSIYHAQKDDSGRFTCITPMGHRHSVDIVVTGRLDSNHEQYQTLNEKNKTMFNTNKLFTIRAYLIFF